MNRKSPLKRTADRPSRKLLVPTIAVLTVWPLSAQIPVDDDSPIPPRQEEGISPLESTDEQAATHPAEDSKPNAEAVIAFDPAIEPDLAPLSVPTEESDIPTSELPPPSSLESWVPEPLPQSSLSQALPGQDDSTLTDPEIEAGESREEAAVSSQGEYGLFAPSFSGTTYSAQRPGGLFNGFDNSPVGISNLSQTKMFFDGLSLSASLTSMYDSNVTKGNDTAGRASADDFVESLGFSVGYGTISRRWTLGANYIGSYNLYTDNSEFSAYTQSADVYAAYKGGKISSQLRTGFSLDNGSSRFLGNTAPVEQSTISTGLSMRYEHSRKTSVTADAGYSFTTTDGAGFNDTDSFDLGLAALYRYSPLTELGPGIRYTRNSGGGGIDRSSIGPTLNLNYKYSSKLSLVSRVGLDFVDYSGGGSGDPSFSTSIGVNYTASALWGMNLTILRDTRADASAVGSFTELSSVRLGYNRKIRRASLGLGVSVDSTSTEVATAGVGAPDRDYLSLDASLGMRIFSNTTSASVFFRYSNQDAGPVESYDSSQIGLSLSRGF